jgi:hypothetical protein
MKRIFTLSILSAALVAAPAAAQTPDSAFAVSSGGVSLFRVNVDAGSVFRGTYDGDINGSGVPAEGAGTRMMWYPRKASFRAGYINGTQWDAANIGSYSVAIGENVRASGDNGVAFGKNSTAAGSSTFAVGEDNTPRVPPRWRWATTRTPTRGRAASCSPTVPRSTPCARA